MDKVTTFANQDMITMKKFDFHDLSCKTPKIIRLFYNLI